MICTGMNGFVFPVVVVYKALMGRQLITNGLLVYLVMVWCNLIRGEIEREMGITLGVDI